MYEELQKEGIQCVGIGADQLAPDAVAIKTDFKRDNSITCVISALDLHISYLKILKAATYLSNPDMLFLATNDDASLPQSDELVMPGAGAILASVAAASGRKPLILGKPHHTMWTVIRDEFKLDPSKTIMIGDRVETDIAFGNKQGLTSILVLTGATSEKQLNELRKNEEENKDLIPKYYIADVQTLRKLIDSNRDSV